MPRSRARRQASGHVTSEVIIGQRPAEVVDRCWAGHWEGDLIIGTGRSAIGTLVERTTRFTILLHLPRLQGYGVEAWVKNGPALAGCGAQAVREAIALQMTRLPEHLRRSLTWDWAGPSCPASPSTFALPLRPRLPSAGSFLFMAQAPDLAGCAVLPAP